MRLHHEIYMSDAREVPPEKWKTVIRHPIIKKQELLESELRRSMSPLKYKAYEQQGNSILEILLGIS